MPSNTAPDEVDWVAVDRVAHDLTVHTAPLHIDDLDAGGVAYMIVQTYLRRRLTQEIKRNHAR
jgi:hypothetical protein